MAFLTIYNGNRRLILTNAISTDLSESFNAIHEYSKDNELAVFIQRFLENEALQTAYIFWDDLDGLMQKVKTHFTFIEAAGGLISNTKGEQLYIFRRGKWDLPKGKREKNETIEETALREVEEECGLKNLVLGNALPSTFHIYKEKKKLILKQTWWFLMTAPNQAGKPQLEEDIEKVEWLAKNNTEKVVLNTFPSIIDVMKAI